MGGWVAVIVDPLELSVWGTDHLAAAVQPAATGITLRLKK